MSSALQNRVSLSLNGRPSHGQKTAQLPHSLHMPSTWTTWCWARPGTSMATLARLGQTSQQASQTLAQPRQRLLLIGAASVFSVPLRS